MKEYQVLVGGEWKESGEIADVRFPYSGETVARVALASEAQLEATLSAAKRSFSVMKTLPARKRYDILNALADLIERRIRDFTEMIVLEGGKTRSAAAVEAGRAAETIRISAEESRRINGEVLPLDWTTDTEGRLGITRRFPVGPVLAITAFNFPLNLACHKLGPAIAAGNPVILKPASATPVCSLMLGELALEAGLPEEAISVVPCPGERAEILAKDPRVAFISFTGSPEVGWHLKEIAGRKRVCLELGGNGPVIVHEDAPLEYAVGRVVTGGFASAGQVCIAVQRVYVHRKIYATFMDMLLPRVRRLNVGDPRDDATDVGPMISPGAAANAWGKVGEAVAGGATLLCGKPPEGPLFSPAVLTGTTPAMRVNREEAFAPFITVTPYDQFDEAAGLATGTEYGLQMGVFTRDIARVFSVFEKSEMGGVIINDIPSFRADPMPYGGTRLSGTGREGPRYAIEEMTELRTMVINRNAPGA
ncbi:acyl-CoA reductase-like NAD-dependent aldehyde dehydrogenase [Methanolinea mesophila]|uniref:aldehyde dehydrogenase family protein n=1 Tax=Methanolinea mesophila TaxID=547055 RepID=UPI001AE578AC|nr:aldehyde dehydrogenase family protein [Methanolinea mesophila]MBP1929863.1 acyl-CoA reductase-like NAD-dependent aldehyde dehydrogenase [Methanolinea mesophila]